MRAWIVVVAGLAHGPVHAVEMLPAADAAYERFEQGERSFEAGDFGAAALAFGEAFALHAQPAYLFNQAVALAKAQRYREAVAALEQFLAEFPKSPRRAEVERKKLEYELERERVRAVIAVHTIPAGAVAALESGESCQTPCELWVEPGAVAIRVSLGSRSRSEARTLGPRERWLVGYDLSPPVQPSVDRTASWVSWGVGASAAVVGAAFALTAQDAHTQAKRLVAASPLDEADFRRLETLRGDVRSRALVADASFGLAIVGVLVGTVLWFTAGETAEPQDGMGRWSF